MSDAAEKVIGTLMMIDDNAIDQMLYKRIVKRSGVAEKVISFNLAEDALAHLQANLDNLPDMILLDINMPRMDGFEFLEAANHTFGAQFSVVVVMLTTSLDPRDMERARSFDAVKRYIDKPLTVEQLNDLRTLV